MRYKYSAKTRDGLQNKSGEIEAANQKVAITMLRESGLVIYSLVPMADNSGIMGFLNSIRGISLNDKVEFTQQISSMISAGLPLPKALGILTQQSGNPRMGKIIQSILSDIEGGSTLSASLEKQGEAFSKSYVSLIKAGEASGKLANIMNRLAHTLEKQRQFRGKVQGALIYPAIITTAMILVFVLIVLYVIPKMTSVYESFDIDLPAMTVFMINLSKFLGAYWWMVLLAIAAFVTGFKFFSRTTSGSYIVNRVTFRLPIFGTLVKNSDIVEFTRTLGLLVDAGVPIIESLEIVRNSVASIIFKDSVNRFIDDVKHGYPLSQTVAKEVEFPMLVSQMLSVGEETGTIGERLNSLSAYYEEEVDKVVKNLSTAIEPVIMVMLGGMVLVLIMAVILPIYQITSSF